MLRMPALSLVALGLITLMCACSSSDSGTPAVNPGDQDAAEEAAEQDAAPEVAEEAAAEASAEAGEDALPEAAIEAAIEAAEASVKKCPNETDLSKVALPCNCYGTVVEDPKTAMPTCKGIVKCCPKEGGLKCE